MSARKPRGARTGTALGSAGRGAGDARASADEAGANRGAAAPSTPESASLESDADGAGHTVVEQQLRAMQQSMRTLQEQHARELAALRTEVQQTRSASSSASSLPSAAAPGLPSIASIAILQARQTAVQPSRLQYGTAAQGTVLADWLFELEQLFTQMAIPESAYADRLRVAGAYWDRQINVWWESRQTQASSSGAAIRSWADFVAALTANFVPAGDAEAAARMLLRVAMRAEESMDAYLQRVELLLARAAGRMDAKTATLIAIEGVDKLRFPWALAAVRKQLRAEPAMTFFTARVELTEAAVHEPKLLQQRQHATSGASARGGASSASSLGRGAGMPLRSAGSGNTVRIAALQRELQQLLVQEEYAADPHMDDEEAAAAAELHTAPLSRPYPPPAARTTGDRPRVCSKCRAPGHVAAECTSKKELRECYACGEVGHIKPNCPKRGGAPRAEGAAPQPKNC